MTLQKLGHAPLAGGCIILQIGWLHLPAKISVNWLHEPANRQRCAVQRRGSPKALAGRIRRDVAHVRAAHFRPGYSGGAGRGRRRVSSTKKSGCSRAPHHPQPPGEWLGWPSSFGGPCAPPISVSSRDRAQGFPSRRRRWRCRGPCAYTERLRAPLVTALAGPGAFLSL